MTISQTEQSPTPLFIAGCPRSGTTALAEYLNAHQEILICIERYKYAPLEITPDLFTFERILDYRDNETNKPWELHARLLEKKTPEKLKWIGDKKPRYFQQFNQLLRDNPDARFVVTYRPVEEVAESFQARARKAHDSWSHDFEEGVRHWNLALRHTREFAESAASRVLIVPYHDFFYQNGDCIALLSRFLGVEFDDNIRKAWIESSCGFGGSRRSKEPLTGKQAKFIERHKDHDTERWILEYIAGQYNLSKAPVEQDNWSKEVNVVNIEPDLLAARAELEIRILENERLTNRLRGQSRRAESLARSLEASRREIRQLRQRNRRLTQKTKHLENSRVLRLLRKLSFLRTKISKN